MLIYSGLELFVIFSEQWNTSWCHAYFASVKAISCWAVVPVEPGLQCCFYLHPLVFPARDRSSRCPMRIFDLLGLRSPTAHCRPRPICENSRHHMPPYLTDIQSSLSAFPRLANVADVSGGRINDNTIVLTIGACVSAMYTFAGRWLVSVNLIFQKLIPLSLRVRDDGYSKCMSQVFEANFARIVIELMFLHQPFDQRKCITL